MKKLLAEFIEQGWIEPSNSEWASPALIVPKKEKGEWRLLVDYRGLNKRRGALRDGKGQCAGCDRL